MAIQSDHVRSVQYNLAILALAVSTRMLASLVHGGQANRMVFFFAKSELNELSYVGLCGACTLLGRLKATKDMDMCNDLYGFVQKLASHGFVERFCPCELVSQMLLFSQMHPWLPSRGTFTCLNLEARVATPRGFASLGPKTSR